MYMDNIQWMLSIGYMDRTEAGGAILMVICYVDQAYDSQCPPPLNVLDSIGVYLRLSSGESIQSWKQIRRPETVASNSPPN